MFFKLIVISCVGFSALCWSACEEAAAPLLPNPDLASEADMLTAQMAVKQYLELQEEFLDCVQHNPRKHNQAIDRMHEVANKFNSTARRYKARMQAQTMFTELVMLER